MKKTILFLTIALFLFGNIGLFAQKESNTPSASVANKTSGNITKAELLAEGKLSVNFTNKIIVSFVLVIKAKEYSNPTGYLFNNDIKTAINALKKNTEIVFKSITVCEKTCSGVTSGLPTEVLKDLTLTLIP